MLITEESEEMIIEEPTQHMQQPPLTSRDDEIGNIPLFAYDEKIMTPR